MLDDYERAPQPRQVEILNFLVSFALDQKKPDIIRQNAFQLIRKLQPLTQKAVAIIIAGDLQDRIGRGSLDLLHARVAHASGTLAYLKQSQRADFFEAFYSQLTQVGHDWRSYPKHGELLRTMQEVGGLRFCPPPVRGKILEWLGIVAGSLKIDLSVFCRVS